MQDDERRAREQLRDMASLLDNSKLKIREYKLPIIPNNYFIQLPDYAALLVPFVLLAFLGFCKYKISNQNPFNGMLIISLSGIAAAMGAYYAGSFF